jgi:hypothetical protein
MKYLLSLAFLLCLSVVSAQTDTAPLPPYMRFPKSVPLNLLLPDSTTRYTLKDVPAKKELMVMVFSPDCEHCKTLMREILASYDRFADIQLVMGTPLGLDKIRHFRQEFDLAKYPGIVVGQDDQFLLPVYYDLKYFPFLGLYSKKKELITGLSGSVTVPLILEKFGK